MSLTHLVPENETECLFSFFCIILNIHMWCTCEQAHIHVSMYVKTGRVEVEESLWLFSTLFIEMKKFT